jgi:hypothetical protein
VEALLSGKKPSANIVRMIRVRQWDFLLKFDILIHRSLFFCILDGCTPVETNFAIKLQQTFPITFGTIGSK